MRNDVDSAFDVKHDVRDSRAPCDGVCVLLADAVALGAHGGNSVTFCAHVAVALFDTLVERQRARDALARAVPLVVLQHSRVALASALTLAHWQHQHQQLGVAIAVVVAERSADRVALAEL